MTRYRNLTKGTKYSGVGGGRRKGKEKSII